MAATNKIKGSGVGKAGNDFILATKELLEVFKGAGFRVQFAVVFACFVTVIALAALRSNSVLNRPGFRRGFLV